jgi:hypothetical protein
MQLSHGVAQPAPRRRRGRAGCLIGCGVAALVLVPLVLVFVFAILPALGIVGGPGFIGPLGGLLNAEPMLKREFNIEMRDLEGADPQRYDPFDYYARVHDFAGTDADLVEIRLTGVRSDGTLDLTATYTPAPRADYLFQRKLGQPPASAPPVGAGGSASGDWYEPVEVEVYRPGQRRRVSRTGGSSSVSIQYTNRGMEREIKAPEAAGEATVAAPPCKLTALWEEAIARGAPASAVAVIEYTADGYRFAISGTAFSYSFDTDCRIKER